MNMSTALETCRESGYLMLSSSETMFFFLVIVLPITFIGGILGYAVGDEL